MAQLKVSHISKAFDDQEILKDVTLELRDNELVSLLGVSGGGKTTLFNVISGLLKPEEGQVFLDGKDITGQPGNVSYMLQKDLLLPYRTIEDNVALPLIIKGEYSPGSAGTINGSGKLERSSGATSILVSSCC